MDKEQNIRAAYVKPEIKTVHVLMDSMRPLQNLPLSQFSPIYTLRRMNIFDRKMPLEVIFE